MRLGRIGLGIASACMGLSSASAQAAEKFKAFTSAMGNWSPYVWAQPSRYKSKPNKLSQKKRRLNARRLGKFK